MAYKTVGSEVMISSKTKVGLNEEIDRFIKEKRPKIVHHQSDTLCPWFEDGEWHLHLVFWMEHGYKPELNTVL